jgi:hypothetical protein
MSKTTVREKIHAPFAGKPANPVLVHVAQQALTPKPKPKRSERRFNLDTWQWEDARTPTDKRELAEIKALGHLHGKFGMYQPADFAQDANLDWYWAVGARIEALEADMGTESTVMRAYRAAYRSGVAAQIPAERPATKTRAKASKKSNRNTKGRA